jgi:hypothetical protein
MKDHRLRSLDLYAAYEMINYLQQKLAGAPGAWEPPNGQPR